MIILEYGVKITIEKKTGKYIMQFNDNAMEYHDDILEVFNNVLRYLDGKGPDQSDDNYGRVIIEEWDDLAVDYADLYFGTLMTKIHRNKHE